MSDPIFYEDASKSLVVDRSTCDLKLREGCFEPQVSNRQYDLLNKELTVRYDAIGRLLPNFNSRQGDGTPYEPVLTTLYHNPHIGFGMCKALLQPYKIRGDGGGVLQRWGVHKKQLSVWIPPALRQSNTTDISNMCDEQYVHINEKEGYQKPPPRGAIVDTQELTDRDDDIVQIQFRDGPQQPRQLTTVFRSQICIKRPCYQYHSIASLISQLSQQKKPLSATLCLTRVWQPTDGFIAHHATLFLYDKSAHHLYLFDPMAKSGQHSYVVQALFGSMTPASSQDYPAISLLNNSSWDPPIGRGNDAMPEEWCLAWCYRLFLLVQWRVARGDDSRTVIEDASQHLHTTQTIKIIRHTVAYLFERMGAHIEHSRAWRRLSPLRRRPTRLHRSRSRSRRNSLTTTPRARRTRSRHPSSPLKLNVDFKKMSLSS